MKVASLFSYHPISTYMTKQDISKVALQFQVVCGWLWLSTTQNKYKIKLSGKTFIDYAMILLN